MKRVLRGTGEVSLDRTSNGLSLCSRTENTKEKSNALDDELEALPEEQDDQLLAASGPEASSVRPHLLSHRQMIKILKHEKTRQANLLEQHEWKLKTFIDPARKLQTGLKAKLGHEI